MSTLNKYVHCELDRQLELVSREHTRSVFSGSLIEQDGLQVSLSSAMKNQIGTSILVNSLAILCGIALGWAAPTVLLYQSPSSPIGEVSVDQVSLIVSLLCIGAIFGTIIFGFLSDVLGRKWMLLSTCIPQLAANVLLLIGTNHLYIYSARFLFGLAGGGCYVLVPLFVSEITQESIRGAMGALMSLCINLGVVVGYVIASWLDYFYVPYVSIGICGLFMAIFVWLPESPDFLAHVGKAEAAKDAYMFYGNTRTGPVTPNSSLDAIEAADAQKVVQSANTKIQLNDFKDRAVIRAVVISIALIIFVDLTGILTLISFITELFHWAKVEVDVYVATIVVGVIQVVGAVISSIFVDRFGRRALLIFSCISTGICFYALGAFFYILPKPEYQDLVAELQWLPLVSVSLGILTSAVGIVTLPFFIIAELLPVKLKGSVTSVAMVLSWIFAFLAIQFYHTMVEYLGVAGTIWFYATNCIIEIFIVYWSLPETKNLTIHEIQELLLNLLAIVYGIAMAWPAPTLVLYESEESPIGIITPEEKSLIVSLLCIGGIVGTIVVGFLADIFGRKRMLLFSSVPYFIGNVLLLIGIVPSYVLIARFLFGFSCGGFFVLIPMFVTEISHESVRGTHGAFLNICCNSGVVVGFAIASWMDYNYVPYVSMAIICVFWLTFSWLPDSPNYLLHVNKIDEAQRAFKFYGNGDVTEVHPKKNHEMVKPKLTMDDFKDSAVQKGIFISFFLIAFVDTNGLFVLTSFVTEFFLLAKVDVDVYVATIAVGLIQLVGSFTSAIFVDRFGRRFLMMASSILSSVCILSLAIYFYILPIPEYQGVVESLRLLPLIALCLGLLVAAVGIMNLPFIISSELLPVKLRATVSSVTMIVPWSLAFLYAQFYHSMVDYFGMSGTLAIYGSSCIVESIFVYAFLPETKNLTIEEIQQKLRKGGKSQ